jgi:hypothetical protein
MISEAKRTLLADHNIAGPETARPCCEIVDAKCKSWNFSISIGWDNPQQINGTISVEDRTAIAP